jgi:hypothetical protein
MGLSGSDEDAYWGSDRLLDLTTVYVHAGEQEPAIDLLQRLLAVPSAISVAQLKVDPFCESTPAAPSLPAAAARPGDPTKA